MGVISRKILGDGRTRKLNSEREDWTQTNENVAELSWGGESKRLKSIYIMLKKDNIGDSLCCKFR